MPEKRTLEAEWIRPSEISFCKIAFPNMLIGPDFPEIFRRLSDLYLIPSEPYERLQQRLIDALDTCEYVEIKGYRGNQTDLRIRLWPLADAEKQTKFLNCGGDLNIPYGEVFTTPRLAGTSGVFHADEICLKGVFYHDLRLVFKNGLTVEADCREGRDYVADNLFYPHSRLAMGEFAIGTNTHVYTLTRKYDMGARLPILIYEKTGPHIAVGDPCFARSEDAPIHNLFDGKEMTCRENEITAKRHSEAGVYFGTHVDMTLPYHQVEYLRGVRADGAVLYFIHHGRFVLAGAEGLNEGLAPEKEE